jgi:hypothetical protein
MGATQMSNETTVVETLRAARGEVDIVTMLKGGSLEARRERLAEALRDPSWDGGPAEIIATYPHHVAAKKDGVIMRIPVIEDKDTIRLGKPEIFSIPTSIPNVSEELMATAMSAAELVLKEDYDSATPMIRGIAGTLDVRGDIQRRLTMDVALRGLGRKTWWQDIVAEHVKSAVELPLPHTDGDDPKKLVSESIDDVLGVLKQNAVDAVKALQTLSVTESAHKGAIECARDIAEDIKSAIGVLSGVNREDLEEMSRVYEAVGRVAPRLLSGIKFLSQLANGS